MIRIVNCKMRHIPSITVIENDCITPPWSEENLRREVEADDSCFLVAVENDAPIGFAIAHRSGDEWELYQIAVTATYRRCGIGEELLCTILDTAGESSVYLEVRRSNTGAISLYKKYGFEELGIRKNYYSAPVEDALILRRERLAGEKLK